MVRFLHTADWQLGMTRHFLGSESQPRFTAARVEVIRTIGALAAAEGCGFVVVAGDVFETNHVERQVVERALDAMAATPAVTFYLLPGNHDPLDAASVFRSPTFLRHRPANVVVLDAPGPVPVAPGIELVAVPWHHKHPLVDLVADAMAGLTADGTTRIVVGHGATDWLSADRANPAAIAAAPLEAALADGRITYVALGDRHSTTSVGSTGRIWYAGAPEPTDFREIDPGNVVLVDLADGTVTAEPRTVGTWRFVAHEASLAGPADVGALHTFLDAFADKARTIVRLSLVGQLGLVDMVTLDEVLDHHTQLFASLERWKRGSELVVLPADGDFGALQLAGFARDGLADLEAHAHGADGRVAQDALALLYRLVGGAA